MTPISVDPFPRHMGLSAALAVLAGLGHPLPELNRSHRFRSPSSGFQGTGRFRYGTDSDGRGKFNRVLKRRKRKGKAIRSLRCPGVKV